MEKEISQFSNNQMNHENRVADNIRQKKDIKHKANVSGSKQADWRLQQQCWLEIPYLGQWEPPELLQTERKNAGSLHDTKPNVRSVSPNNLLMAAPLLQTLLLSSHDKLLARFTSQNLWSTMELLLLERILFFYAHARGGHTGTCRPLVTCSKTSVWPMPGWNSHNV